MTFATQEAHPYAGAPVEYYKFSLGTTVWRWTSSDEVFSIPDPTTSHEYSPAPIERDAADFSTEDIAGNVTVRIPVDSPVAAPFIPYSPTSPIGLTIYTRHRGDSEIAIVFIGKVTSVTFESSKAVLTCSPIAQVLQRKVPRLLYQAHCNWALYSAACGVDRTGFDTAATLTGVSGSTIVAAAFDALADGWFKNGWVVLADGDRRFIVDHVGDTLTLMSPFPGLAVGTAVTAYAGCDRTAATCLAKFANLANHFGFSRIPSRNPFGGGSID